MSRETALGCGCSLRKVDDSVRLKRVHALVLVGRQKQQCQTVSVVAQKVVQADFGCVVDAIVTVDAHARG